MSKKSGFTLIELLIVIIIISIVAGIAIITINTNQNKQYETLGKQLANSILLAEQEAMLRPATLGLGFTNETFQFFTFEYDAKQDKNTWVPLKETALQLHRLPSHTQIKLKMHGEVIPPNSSPQLIITPSNDLTPFVILIGKPDETPYYEITGKANGEVTSEIYRAE